MEDKLAQSIRKAYFNGSLQSELDRISSQEPLTEEFVAELDKYLSQLENEREKTKQRLERYDTTATSMKLPSVSELMDKTEEEKEKIEKWVQGAERSYKVVRDMIAMIKRGVREVNEQLVPLSRKDRLDIAMEISAHQYELDALRVWKDQNYRAKIVHIIDTYGCSRKEAEERAKLTREYQEYKRAVLFRELVEETIMLAKKYE